MGKLLKLLIVMLLVLPTIIMFVEQGTKFASVAQEEDPIEDEDIDDGEGIVADEGDDIVSDLPTVQETEKEDEEEEAKIGPSPDADTYIHFTKPVNMEFPAGHLVRFVVGFTNNGKEDFTVESMDASFRYPQDYSFYIQNFTAMRYDRLVESQRQATFEYAFTPSETFSARPFGLTINLNYKDAEDQYFQDAVFNETINIIEPDEGLDGETFFLYVFLAAIAVLLLVGLQQLLSGVGKKHLSRPKQQIETGTQKGDVDYDWIPKETLNEFNRTSPGNSPRQSPGRRRTKRNKATADD